MTGFLRRATLVLPLAAVVAAAALAMGCSERDPLTEARSLQSNGRIADSLEPLRRLLVSDPDSAEVQYRYGLALARTGKPGMAIWSLRRAQEDPEWAVRAGLELARSALVAGNHGNAIEAASRVLEVEPENVDALSIRASSQLGSLVEPELAIADLERAIELDPENVLLRSSLVQALIMSDRIDEAVETFDEIDPLFEKASGSQRRALGPVCAMRVVFAYERGEAEEAETQLDRCLEEFPVDVVVLDTAIDFYDGRQEPERGNELLRSAIEERPTWLRFRTQLAHRLRLMDEPDEAEAVLRAGLDQDFPGMREAIWTQLAQHFIELDDPDRAVDAYAEAVALSPEVSEVGRLTHADMLVAADRTDEALEIARELESELYRNLVRARVELAEHRPERALELFDEVLPRWPDNAGARYFAARAAEEVGDFDRAIEEYRQSIRSDPAAGDAGIRLAKLLLSLGDTEAAWHIVFQHVRAQPGDREGRLLQMRIALMQDVDVVRTQLEALSTTVFWPDAMALYLTWIAERAGASNAVERFRSVSGFDLTQPANAAVLRSLVPLLIEAGDAATAKAAVADAIRAHPDRAAFHSIAGLVAELNPQDEGDARSAYRRALELDPEEPHALEAMAKIYRREGNNTAALAYFDRAALVDPERVEVHLDAARLFAKSGAAAAEIEARWRSVLRDFPWEPEPQLRLARICLDRSDIASATAFGESAARLGGGADAWELLSKVYRAAGEPVRAEEAQVRAGRHKSAGQGAGSG